MSRSLALALTCALAAAPALAGEPARPRLVAGGLDLAQSDNRLELFTKGGFSAGAVTDSAESGRERMALGGYAAYAFRDVTLSSSLKGDFATSGADLSASYFGGLMGVDGTASLKLGYDWGKPLAFSINPAQAGLSAYNGAYDPARPADDLSLTLSFTHDVTPSLSLGGFAAASREKEDGAQPQSGLSFGAGVGYRF